MDMEVNDIFPSLDVLDMKNGPNSAVNVYRKLTHTRRYLHLSPTISPRQKMSRS
jgi:hypothetical protein